MQAASSACPEIGLGSSLIGDWHRDRITPTLVSSVTFTSSGRSSTLSSKLPAFPKAPPQTPAGATREWRNPRGQQNRRVPLRRRKRKPLSTGARLIRKSLAPIRQCRKAAISPGIVKVCANMLAVSAFRGSKLKRWPGVAAG